MKVNLTLEQIAETLNSSLELISKAQFSPTSYEEFLKTANLNDTALNFEYRDMGIFSYNVKRLLDFIKEESNIYDLMKKISNGVKISVEAVEIWRNENISLLHPLYILFDTYKTKIMEKRETAIKQILSFECCMYAQIALQHLDGFGGAFKSELHFQHAKEFIIPGYHANGTINVNLMDSIKSVYNLSLPYNKLKKRYN